MATDLQTRKLNLISYIAELKDEKFIEKIEKYILKRKSNNPDLSPFTIEELVERIKTSESDYANGKIKTQDELESESAICNT